MQKPNFIVYGKPSCPQCDKAKNYLSSKGFGFRYSQLGSDFSREDLMSWFPSAKAFPIIVMLSNIWTPEEQVFYTLDSLTAYIETKELSL